jgi:hypothetical protein
MSYTGRLPRGARLGLRLKIVLALYVLAAALMPLACHDILCHIKSTTHCAVCSIGSSEAAAEPALPERFWLRDAGAAVPAPPSNPASVTSHTISGRAPPALG